MELYAVLTMFGVQPSEFRKLDYMQAQELARRMIEMERDKQEADWELRLEMFKAEQKNLGYLFSELARALAAR